MKARQISTLLILVVFFCVQFRLNAQQVIRNGYVFYRLNDSDMTATVVQPEYDETSGFDWELPGWYENEYYNFWGTGSLRFYIKEYVENNGRNYTVTTIGKKALAYLDKNNWIDYNTGFTEDFPVEIELPESIICIEDSAFYKSTAIRLDCLPGNIKTFGKDVFVGCKNDYLWIGLPCIPDRLFHDSGIGRIEMTDTLTSIGREAFANSTINTIVLSNGIEEIKSLAFADIKNLNEIWLDCDTPPATEVDTFGKDRSGSTFSATLNVPEKDIEYYRDTAPWSWFQDISATEKGTLVDGIYYRLDHESGTAKVTAEDTYVVQTGGKGYYSGAVSVPQKFVYEGVEYTTTEVADWAFARCGSLESVSLPQSIVKIGTYAFLNSGGYKRYFTVNLPESIQEIGQCAFMGAWVKDICWPSSVKTIEAFMFDMGYLKNITLPDGLESIGAYAFAKIYEYEDNWIDKLFIPKTVAEIGEKAFLNSHIEELYIECDTPPVTAPDALDGYTDRNLIWNGVEYLRVLWKDEEYYRTTEPWSKINGYDYGYGKAEFFDGTMDDPYFDRTHIVEVDGMLCYLNPKFHLASIAPGWDFENNAPDPEYYQGDLVVPGSIEHEGMTYRVSTIEPSAFMGASGLNSATLPEGMVYVGENAFSGSGLRSVRWPSTAREVEAGSFSSTLLNRIDIPEGVIGISEYAFADCKQLSEVFFPSTMEWIGSFAFPSEVSTIYTYSATPPRLTSPAFGKDDWKTYANATVYVPYGCIQKYENSSWYHFKNFVEMSEGSVESIEIYDETEVYNLDGRRVNADDFCGGSLPHGVYVVRSAGKVWKVMK